MVKSHHVWPESGGDGRTDTGPQAEQASRGGDVDHVALADMDEFTRLTHELEAELFGTEQHAVERAFAANRSIAERSLSGLRQRASAAARGEGASQPVPAAFFRSDLDDDEARLLAARLAPATRGDSEVSPIHPAYDNWAASPPHVVPVRPSRATLLVAATALVMIAGASGALLLQNRGGVQPVEAAAVAPAEVPLQTETAEALAPLATPVAAVPTTAVPVQSFRPTLQGLDGTVATDPGGAVETTPRESDIVRPPAAITGSARSDDGPAVAAADVAPAAPVEPEPDVAEVVADRWNVAGTAPEPAPDPTVEDGPAADEPSLTPADVLAYAPIARSEIPMPLDTPSRPVASAAAPEKRQAERPAAVAPPEQATDGASTAPGSFAIATTAPLVTIPTTTGSVSGTAVVNSDVNLRAKPENGSEVVAVIPNGQSVAVLSCDKWCNVSYGGREGWVFRRFVAQAN